MRITTTFTNNNPNTIWNRLAARLGREPTNGEAIAEVQRLKTEDLVDMAARGALPMQRGRT